MTLHIKLSPSTPSLSPPPHHGLCPSYLNKHTRHESPLCRQSHPPPPPFPVSPMSAPYLFSFNSAFFVPPLSAPRPPQVESKPLLVQIAHSGHASMSQTLSAFTSGKSPRGCRCLACRLNATKHIERSQSFVFVFKLNDHYRLTGVAWAEN